MVQKIYHKNPILYWLGLVHLIFFLVLLVYYPFNNTLVLGINAVIKPMKFALSIWIYSWTMALLLHYIKDTGKVKLYSWVAVMAMYFEQIAITSQALQGELSHFNTHNAYGIVVFALMGVFILTITLWTAYIAFIFIKQKDYDIPPALVLGIKIGLIYFVIFSLFGGYISSLKGHTVGSIDGGKGLPFLNWSRFFGDLRVAHFFGIHSLQIIPLFAFVILRYTQNSFSVKAVWIFATTYLMYVLFTMIQGFMGLPFSSI